MKSTSSDQHEPLDERIKQFYDNQALPYDTLQAMRGLIVENSAEIPPPSAPFLTRWTRPLSYAIVLLLLLFSGLLLLQQQLRQQQIETVAAEIALNHAKQFNTEVAPASIANLASEMPLLDFSPVHPKRLQYNTYNVEGARYCTIDSAIAVQVHLTDLEQQTLTLYQFRNVHALPLGDEKTVTIDDIQVTLWREGEVVMGLAERIME